MHTEEVLLEALCFELTVEHPYHYLLALFENHFTKDQHRKARLVFGLQPRPFVVTFH